jgi:hypothetical protein
MKAWQFKLKLKNKIIITHVYSDTGNDIEQRFPEYEVSDIKEIEDPTTKTNKENDNVTK